MVSARSTIDISGRSHAIAARTSATGSSSWLTSEAPVAVFEAVTFTEQATDGWCARSRSPNRQKACQREYMIVCKNRIMLFTERSTKTTTKLPSYLQYVQYRLDPVFLSQTKTTRILVSCLSSRVPACITVQKMKIRNGKKPCVHFFKVMLSCVLVGMSETGLDC